MDSVAGEVDRNIKPLVYYFSIEVKVTRGSGKLTMGAAIIVESEHTWSLLSWHLAFGSILETCLKFTFDSYPAVKFLSA